MKKEEMEKLKDIDTHVKEVLTLLFRITRYYKELNYLNTELTQQERFEYKGKFELFQYAEDAMFIVLIMDLSILYKPDEDYSLKGLLDKAKDNFGLLNKEHGITIEHLNDWSQDLRQQKIKGALGKVIRVRNEHFAHIDSERKNIESLMPSLKELQKLIDVAVSVTDNFYFFTTGIGLFIRPIYKQSGSESLIENLRTLTT
jgi:hypothetical protein